MENVIKVYAVNEELEAVVLDDNAGEIGSFNGVNIFVGEDLETIYVEDEEGSYIELCASFRSGDITEKDLYEGSFQSASKNI